MVLESWISDTFDNTIENLDLANLSGWCDKTNLHLYNINFCHQGATICQEGGRYKLVSDGDNNNMIMLAITKVKSTDEGEYRVVIENCHGSDEKTFMLYVSGKIANKNNLPCNSTPSRL